MSIDDARIATETRAGPRAPSEAEARAAVLEALCRKAEKALANAVAVINPHVWNSVKAQCEDALAELNRRDWIDAPLAREPAPQPQDPNARQKSDSPQL